MFKFLKKEESIEVPVINQSEDWTKEIKRSQKIGQEVDEESFDSLLDTSGMSPVDILIRTGGDKRLSNYLLWQAAYSELFFSNTLWPDFNSDELDSIIKSFDTIERRFGDAK